MALRLAAAHHTGFDPDAAGVFGRCARATSGVSCSDRLSRRRLPPPPRRLRRGAAPAQRVRLAHDGYFWSADVYAWRRSRQFGGGAGSAEPSCRAVGRAARATGAACGPGEISAAGAEPEDGDARALRQQRALSGGLARRERRPGGCLRWQFGAPAESCLPYQGREGPQFRPTPGGPGDSEPGRSSSRGLPEGASPAEPGSLGVRPRSPPQVATSAPGRYVKPRGRAAGAARGTGRRIGRFSDNGDCKGRDRGGGRGPCRSGWPVPGGSAATGGTDALDAAWGGRF